MGISAEGAGAEDGASKEEWEISEEAAPANVRPVLGRQAVLNDRTWAGVSPGARNPLPSSPSVGVTSGTKIALRNNGKTFSHHSCTTSCQNFELWTKHQHDFAALVAAL